MAANINRRNFLAAGMGLPAIAADPGLRNPRRQRLRAVAFDALVLFDLRHVGRLAEQLFPGAGTELFREWRTRQFEYAWLRTITGRFVDFWLITSDALITAAEAMKLRLPASDLNSLLAAYLDLRPWPDVIESILMLRESGLRLVILSNFTERMLRRSEVTSLFERVLSTELARTYKPQPAAYQLAVDALSLSGPEILFAAFASWDAAGAKAFGLPTVWVNRSGGAWDPLGEAPDHSTESLAGLMTYVRA